MQAIYIHIPFCIKKCNYCDFTSYPLSLAGYQADAYCSAVKKELTMWSQQIREKISPIKSIYIGGGTPTCLPAEKIAGILAQVSDCFPLAPGAEVTVECNPGTVDENYFLLIKEAGVNRVSIGAQAFQERHLKAMGRIHGTADIFRAVHDAQRAGLSNINLDLIYGLPGQTMEEWQESLDSALLLDVPHIAAYGLKVENNTPWGKARMEGKLDVLDEDRSADMLEYAIDCLENAGCRQYEISNFARRGYCSKHNKVYWKYGDYLGVGAAAVSHFGNVRRTNLCTIGSYLKAVEKGSFPVAQEELLDDKTAMAEAVFLGLRLMRGIDENEFCRRFGVTIIEKYPGRVEKLSRLGLLERSGSRLRLTRKGLFLANEVFLEFLP